MVTNRISGDITKLTPGSVNRADLDLLREGFGVAADGLSAGLLVPTKMDRQVLFPRNPQYRGPFAEQKADAVCRHVWDKVAVSGWPL